MSLRTTGGVTFDDVRQAVQPRSDWNEDHDADGRERWSGPCPLAAPNSEVACRISAGQEHLDDEQEVLMACNQCNLSDPGHLGKWRFLKHLEELGCDVDWD